MKARTGRVNRPKVAGTYVPGTYYETVVPDTLDLAERAKFSVKQHAPWAAKGDAKHMEALALTRLMCGSRAGLDLEAEAMLLMPALVAPEHFTNWGNLHYIGRRLRTMIRWYQITGDPIWKERVDRLVDDFDRLMVVHKSDYAYIPTDRGSGEPEKEKIGVAGDEGSLFNREGHIPGALSEWYMITGNERAFRLARDLVHFYTKPKFWADWEGGEYPEVVGAEHAHWQGHHTGYINTLRAILEYAIAANDSRLKLFVREGYEWTRKYRIARIGFTHWCCAYPRLLGLAVKLSDAEVGDYWEDVDLYIRNHASEMQVVPEDRPHLLKVLEGKPHPQFPGESADSIADQLIGGFPGDWNKSRFLAACCTSHGNMALFYAWDGIVRYSNGTARINLLLNRASPWLDIDSYIPYEGKVVLRNKKARDAFVRIPLYVDLGTVTCKVGQKRIEPKWFGRYVWIDKLKPGDVVTIEFPLVEWTETWSSGVIPGEPFNAVLTIKLKGNTVISITPPLVPEPDGLYQARAAKYSAAMAPMKKVTRYTTDFRLAW